jgi:hypothetical protein
VTLTAVLVIAIVDPLAEEGRVGRAGITDLEVAYGSRNAREWDQDMDDLSIFELVETTRDSRPLLPRHPQRRPQVAASSSAGDSPQPRMA